MKRLSGFSLMEMMVVLLIVSIVAAASAPMINKKLLTAASEKSPWVWTSLDNSIAYNLNGADAKATIGRTTAPAAANDSRLYIDSRSNGTQFTPQLAFGQGGSNIIKLRAFNRNFIVSNNTNNFMNNSATNSVAIGYGSLIGRANSVAIGHAALSDTDSVAIGHDSLAEGGESVAIGSGAKDNAGFGVVIGKGADSGDVGAVAIGHNAFGSYHSVAIGPSANASISNDSVAVGNNTTALNASSVAIGHNTTAGAHSIAMGRSANASSVGSVAIGPSTTTEGSNYSTAIGYGVGASNHYSVGLGYLSYATAFKAVAIGSQAGASQKDAIAIGNNSTASGESSIAIGSHQTGGNTTASGASSIAIGDGAHAEHDGAVAIGWEAGSTTPNQIVLGKKDTIVYIPGKLVVNGMAVLGYANGASTAGREYATVIRSIRGGGLMEVLDRDGDGDWDAVHATSERVDYSWASGKGMSDRRLKNVGKAFIGGLKEIKQLETFNYTFKKDPTKTPRVGVMAQDLQKIFPQAVFKGEDGFLRIRMEDMFYALINAVKELDAKIEKLGQEVASILNNEIEKLKKENTELKKRLEKLEKENTELEKRLEKLEKKIK